MDLHDLGAQAPVKATYTPRRELAGLYDELFGEFVEIYKKTRGIYRRLNRGHAGEI